MFTLTDGVSAVAQSPQSRRRDHVRADMVATEGG